MERPRSHVLESESKKELLNIIPVTWVTRELPSDYGLDYMIEIFHQGKSTGSIFFLQLKASDQTIKNDTFKYKLSRKHIEHYNLIPNPILLTFYSAKLNKFWAIWANRIQENLNGSKYNSHSITLRKVSLIDLSFFQKLEIEFSNTIISKVNINSSSKGELGGLIETKINTWLNFYYKDDLLFQIPQITNSINIIYNSNKNNKVSVYIEAPHQNIKVLLQLESEEIKILNYPVFDTNNVTSELSKILVVFASILKAKNILSSTEILLLCLNKCRGELLTIETIFDFGSRLLRGNSTSLYFQLASKSLESPNHHICQFLTLTILFTESGARFAPLYQKIILLELEKDSSSHSKATGCYNIANSYRSTGFHKEAMKYYLLARKFDPKYLSMEYWWREAAGSLFLLGHPKISESFYLKSISLNSIENIDTLTYALLGDSQFHQAKFKIAIQNFEEYFNKSDKPKAEYHLKHFTSQILVDMGLDSIKFQIDESNAMSKKAIEIGKPEKLTQAINLFPLNGLAWFNYGVYLYDKNELKESLYAYLITSCIQTWDKEAWKNGLIISFQLKEHLLLSLIFKASLEFHGQQFVNYLSDHILSEKHLTTDQKTKIIDSFKEMSDQILNSGK